MRIVCLYLALMCLFGFGWGCSITEPDVGGVEHNGPIVMRGMYRYLADAAIFTDCKTGKSHPVAMEGDNRTLEVAYMRTRHQPGEPLLVTLEGRIVVRMPMEGPGPVATLLPEKFLSISPGESCDVPSR